MTEVWREGWWASALEVLRAVLLCLHRFAASLYDLRENLSTCTCNPESPPRDCAGEKGREMQKKPGQDALPGVGEGCHSWLGKSLRGVSGFLLQ